MRRVASGSNPPSAFVIDARGARRRRRGTPARDGILEERGGNIVIARGGRSGMIPPDGWFPDGWFPDGWFPRRTLARRFDFVVVVRLFDIGGGGGGRFGFVSRAVVGVETFAREGPRVGTHFGTLSEPRHPRGVVEGSRRKQSQGRAFEVRRLRPIPEHPPRVRRVAGRSPRAHE